MRNLRKLMAFMVVVAMMFSTIAFAASVPEDVIDTDSEEAVVTLGALDIIQGYDEDGVTLFKPDNTITRAEFAAVMTRALGMGTAVDALKGPTPFIDVPVDHWATGNINMAVQIGFIVGHGDGTFGPEDPVTFEQAIKMIVSSLGYDRVAATRGGYPTGYLVVASQEQITKGVKGGSGEPALRGTVAKLLYNSLEVGLMEQKTFPRDPADAEFAPGDRTLLDELDVIKATGVVVANEFTSIDGPTEAGEGEVFIDVREDRKKDIYEEDGRPFLVGATKAAEYIGYSVNFYFKEDRYGDDVIISISPRAGENRTFTINASDIAEVAEVSRLTENRYYYWVDKDYDNNPSYIDLEEEINIIYNGKYETSEDFYFGDNYGVTTLPQSGKVVFLDNNRNNKYDYMFVTNYEVGIVDEVNTRTQKIFFDTEFASTITSLDLDESRNQDIRYTIIKDGKEIGLEDLRKWDVLSIARSSSVGQGTQVINILVSDATVEGMINEIDENAGTVFIDGKEYEFSSTLLTIGHSDIATGAEGIFYLDIDGRIAANDTTLSRAGNYAYLLEAGLGRSYGEYYEFKLLNKDNEIVNLDLAEYVTIDGSRMKAGLAIADEDLYDGTLDAEGKVQANPNGTISVIPQLITYELNRAGEISKINLAGSLSTGEYYDRSKFVAVEAKTDLEYRESINRIGTRYYVDDSTLVFEINDTDSEKSSVRKISSLTDEGIYDAVLYDSLENRVVSVMVVYGKVGAGLDTNPIALVDRVTQTTNDKDGTPADRLYAIYDGERDYSILAESGLDIYGDIVTGDIIQFDTTSDNELDANYQVVFSAQDKEIKLANNGVKEGTTGKYYDSEQFVIYGEIVKRSGGRIDLEFKDGENDVTRSFTINKANIYKYEEGVRRNPVTIAELGDVEASDRDPNGEKKYAFVRVYDYLVEEVVLYNWVDES